MLPLEHHLFLFHNSGFQPSCHSMLCCWMRMPVLYCLSHCESALTVMPWDLQTSTLQLWLCSFRSSSVWAHQECFKRPSYCQWLWGEAGGVYMAFKTAEIIYSNGMCKPLKTWMKCIEMQVGLCLKMMPMWVICRCISFNKYLVDTLWHTLIYYNYNIMCIECL
jgi:hypothetical protein